MLYKCQHPFYNLVRQIRKVIYKKRNLKKSSFALLCCFGIILASNAIVHAWDFTYKEAYYYEGVVKKTSDFKSSNKKKVSDNSANAFTYCSPFGGSAKLVAWIESSSDSNITAKKNLLLSP